MGTSGHSGCHVTVRLPGSGGTGETDPGDDGGGYDRDAVGKPQKFILQLDI